MEQTEQVDFRRAIEELRELDDLTGGPEGARRVEKRNLLRKGSCY